MDPKNPQVEPDHYLTVDLPNPQAADLSSLRAEPGHLLVGL
jgi:hypothetical protein